MVQAKKLGICCDFESSHFERVISHKKIPVDIDFTPAQDYLDMMKELRENILVKEHDDVTLLKTTLDYRGLFL
jgi:antitoxin component of RelBE/YafQ-DinJ toxin-antitoxin module